LQMHMRELIENFPVRGLRWPLRVLVFPLGSGRLSKPSDDLGKAVAESIVIDGPARDRIIRGAYYNVKPDDSLGRVLNAYRLANDTQALREALHKAVRERDPADLDGIALLMGHQREELVDWAVTEQVIDETDRQALLDALTALYDVIRVDAFDADGISTISKSVRGKRKVVERH
jgi:acyl-CoA dehydrogenase